MKRLFIFFLFIANIGDFTFAQEINVPDATIRVAAVFDLQPYRMPLTNLEWLGIKTVSSRNCCVFDSATGSFASLKGNAGNAMLSAVKSTEDDLLVAEWKRTYSVHDKSGEPVKNAQFTVAPIVRDGYIWGANLDKKEGVLLSQTGDIIYILKTNTQLCTPGKRENNILLNCYFAGWIMSASEKTPETRPANILLDKTGKVLVDYNQITNNEIYRWSLDGGLSLSYSNSEKKSFLLFMKDGKWIEQDTGFRARDEQTKDSHFLLLSGTLYAQRIAVENGYSRFYDIINVKTGARIKHNVPTIKNISINEFDVCADTVNDVVHCERLDAQGNFIKSVDEKNTLSIDGKKSESFIARMVLQAKAFYMTLISRLSALWQGHLATHAPAKTSHIRAQCHGEIHSSTKKMDDVNLLVAAKNTQGLCGYKRGEDWIIAPEFTTCNDFNGAVAVIESNGEKAILNSSGHWLTPKPKPKSYYEEVWAKLFGQGREIRGYVGVIDQKGNWVIPPLLWPNQFFKLDENSLISCNRNGEDLNQCKRYLLNSADAPTDIANIARETPPLSSELLAAVPPYAKAENNVWGFVNAEGNWVIKPQFAKVSLFSEGLAAASLDGDVWGYINQQGEMVVAPKYTQVRDFHQGVAWGFLNNIWILLDTQGKELTTQEITSVNDFESDVTSVNEGQYLVYKDGRILEPAGKIYAKNLNAELMPAMVGNLSGYVNQKGEWAIEPQFGLVEDFIKGFAIARSAQVWQPNNLAPVRVKNIVFSPNKKAAYVNFIVDGASKAAVLDTETAEWLVPDPNCL